MAIPPKHIAAPYIAPDHLTQGVQWWPVAPLPLLAQCQNGGKAVSSIIKTSKPNRGKHIRLTGAKGKGCVVLWDLLRLK